MARNGSGGFSLLINTWNPATTGVSATVTDWQALINDIATAMQQSVSSDGQTAMTGNLAMGNNKLTGLAEGSATGHSLRWEQLFSQGTIANLASATTTDIGAQNTSFLNITGTTTIAGFGSNFNGPRYLVFAGILTLTNSATLVCPGAANITTAANDAAIAIPISGGWQIVAYQKASGLPISTTGLAPLSSPTFTGTPSAPTAAAATNTTQLATTAFVQQEVPAASTTVAGKVELVIDAEVVTGTDTTRAVTSAALHAGKSVLGTLTASTSGTAINFTGIPAWAKRITVMFNAMSTSGTSPPTVRIGDSGGVEATGYLGTTLTFANASPVGSVSSTTGFDLTATNASTVVYHGAIIITLMDASTNLWVCSGVVNRSDAGAGATLGYNKTLSATLDRVQITTNNGTDTFDAGSVNILYE